MAELLSQLPSDLDVERMVMASYEAVLKHKLNKSECVCNHLMLDPY